MYDLNYQPKTNKWLYPLLAFAAFWYFFFASTFSLRPYPQLFWICLAALAAFFAFIHNHALSKTDVAFVLGLCAIMFITIFSVDKMGSLINLGNYAIYYVVARMLAKNCKAKAVYAVIFFFCAVHLVCIFVQVISPDIYTAYLLPLLPSTSHVKITENMLYNSSFFGFTIQTSMCALYLSVGAIISALIVRCAKKLWIKAAFAVATLLFVFGLFFTTRRGSVAVVLFILAIMYLRSKGTVFSKVLTVLAGAIFVLIVGLENIPGLNGVLEKFETMILRGDITNGRETAFAEALSIFWQRPFFGYGFGQSETALGYAWLENSYIVVLIEGGLLGACAFFAPVLIVASNTRKRIKENDSDFSLLLSGYIQMLFVFMSLIENYFASPLTMFLFYSIVFAAEKANVTHASLSKR